MDVPELAGEHRGVMDDGGFWRSPSAVGVADTAQSSQPGVALSLHRSELPIPNSEGANVCDVLCSTSTSDFLHRFQLPAGETSFESQQPCLYNTFQVHTNTSASLPTMVLTQGQDTGLTSDDQCPVCGDRVSGYHYGLQTCESCKGFFKRTVQNGKVYMCIEKQECIVTKAQRKRCPYCRFQKCLSVGMKLEAVRADRMRGGRNKFGPLYKYDRAVKQQRQQILSSQLYVHGSSGPVAEEKLDQGMEIPVPSSSPIDVKPDINLLPSFAAASDHSVPTRSYFAKSSLGSPLPQQPRSVLSHIKSYSAEEVDSADGAYQREGAGSLTGSSPQGIYDSCSFQPFYPSSRNVPLTNQSGPIITDPIISSTCLVGVSNIMSEMSTSLSPSVPSLSTLRFHGQCYSRQLEQQQLQHQQLQQQQQQLQLHNEQWQQLPPDRLQYGSTHIDADPAYASYKDQWYNSQTSCFPTSGFSASTYPLSTSSFCQSLPYASPTIPACSTALPFTAVPLLIKELQQNEPSRSDLQQKLGMLIDPLLQQHSSLVSPQSGVERSSLGSDPPSDECSLRSTLQLICRLCDRSLFMLVEWARGAHLFRELKVDCQMRLLQASWSELLIFNIVFQQTLHPRTDELLMVTGHMIRISLLVKLGLQVIVDHLTELIRKVRELSLDANEYCCLKFIILLNPDISGLSCRELVEQFQERVNTALLEYCSIVDSQVNDRFGQLLMLLHDVRLVSLHGEEFLYSQQLDGNILENTLLAEMLHSRQL